jgi:peptidoglycan DL-endopeptidase LytE
MLISTQALADKTYTVKKGDSLYKISKRFKTKVEAISEANKLESNKLLAGTELIIPSKEIQKENAPEVNASPSINTQAENTKDTDKIKEIINAPELQRSKLKEFLIFVAQQTLGIPYRFGSNTFMRTDCSGYVQNVFSLLGLNLPRSAREQFHIGEAVDKKDLSMGDLVFFRTYASFPSHVGIYLGNNLFIHASALGRKVTIDSLTMPYFVKRFIGARRLPGIDEVSAYNSQNLLKTIIR